MTGGGAMPPEGGADTKLRAVVVMLCDACLDGEGGECHTPGCALWMNRAPDVPWRDKIVTTVRFEMTEADRVS